MEPQPIASVPTCSGRLFHAYLVFTPPPSFTQCTRRLTFVVGWQSHNAEAPGQDWSFGPSQDWLARKATSLLNCSRKTDCGVGEGLGIEGQGSRGYAQYRKQPGQATTVTWTTTRPDGVLSSDRKSNQTVIQSVFFVLHTRQMSVFTWTAWHQGSRS